MWIERQIGPRLLRLAATRPVLVLSGARQTGKTALIRRLFAAHHYVSLDLPSEAAQAEQDPAAFLARHPLPLVVDEVQYAPGLFCHLTSVGDADRQAARLSALPLAERLLRGGFPELIAQPAIDATEYFASYVATYLERDLRSQLQVSNLRDFERFLRAAALRSAQLLNRAELARDVGISNSTAGIWLALLERSGLVVLLEPWFSNGTKRLVKAPKLYLADTGLLAFLVGLRSGPELLASPLVGALWETHVLMDLRRQAAAVGDPLALHFWRDRSKEVDLVLQRGGRYWLADAKWSELPQPADARRLAQVAAELGANAVVAQALICRTPNRYPLGPAVEALPLAEAATWLGIRPAEPRG